MNENAGTLTFIITRSSSAAAATVYASTVQDEGTNNTNNEYYTGVANQLVSFSAGQSQATVNVSIKDLGLTFGSETFRFIVQQKSTDPTSTYLATDNFTIQDNDTGGGGGSSSGIDYRLGPGDASALSGVNLAAISGDGYGFVAEYIGTATDDGYLTKGDAVELSQDHISIVSIFERNPTSVAYFTGATDGISNAQYDAADAIAAAKADGQPTGSTIYFTVDYDPTSQSDFTAIDNYFAQVKTDLGSQFKLGVYGPGDVLSSLKADAAARPDNFWLDSYAWPADGFTGQNITRIQNTVSASPTSIGLNVDLDAANTSNYGQWTVAANANSFSGDVATAEAAINAQVQANATDEFHLTSDSTLVDQIAGELDPNGLNRDYVITSGFINLPGVVQGDADWDQCVALVLGVDGELPHLTGQWIPGQQVDLNGSVNTNIAPGTPIATFVNGIYNSAHAAIFLGPGSENNEAGFFILDQYNTTGSTQTTLDTSTYEPAEVRFIELSSDTSSTLYYTISTDTVPPSLTISSTGGLTNQTTQTISGTIDAADAGLSVSIYDGTTLLGTATPAGNGNWSKSVTLLSTQGAQAITAKATDAAGNVGTSNTASYTLDTQTTDPQGNVVSQTIPNASGTQWVNTYDPENTASSMWTTSSYDANGNLTSQSGTNIDGTHWLSMYDVNNQYSWSNVTINFDALWNQTSITGTNDNGTHNISAGSIASAYDTLQWFATPFNPNWNSTAGVSLTGDLENDTLVGGAGDDTFTAGTGNDLFYGNGGSNTFVFGLGSGKDTIADFQPTQDTIQFNPALFANYAAVLQDTTQVGANTVIQHDANSSVTLENVAASSLTANNFHFS